MPDFVVVQQNAMVKVLSARLKSVPYRVDKMANDWDLAEKRQEPQQQSNANGRSDDAAKSAKDSFNKVSAVQHLAVWCECIV